MLFCSVFNILTNWKLGLVDTGTRMRLRASFTDVRVVAQPLSMSHDNCTDIVYCHIKG